MLVFDRNKKPIGLTEKGATILEQVKSILREHRKLHYIASSKSKAIQGDFSLAIIPSVSQYLTPLFLKRFYECYPDVNLTIDEYKTEEIISLLTNDQIDAGLLVTPLNEHAISEHPIFYEKFSVYFSEGHELLKKEKLLEFDLDENKIWLLGDGHCFREQVLRVCSLKERTGVMQSIRFSGGSLETLKQLVCKMGGYTLLPELAASSMGSIEAQNHLRPFEAPVPTREVSLVHSKGFYKSSILKALTEAIQSTLPESISLGKERNTKVIELK